MRSVWRKLHWPSLTPWELLSGSLIRDAPAGELPDAGAHHLMMADGTPPNSDRWLLGDARRNGAGGLLPPEEGDAGAHDLGNA
jgi:hypothetical protein